MKIKIVLVLIAMIIKQTEKSRNESNAEIKSYDVYNVNVSTSRVYIDEQFAVIIIDGCEYLISTSAGHRGFMAHKGDCKKCSKNRQDEIRKVLKDEGVSRSLW